MLLWVVTLWYTKEKRKTKTKEHSKHESGLVLLGAFVIKRK